MYDKNQDSAAEVIRRSQQMKNIMIVQGLIVGILAGVLAIVYRILLLFSERLLNWVLNFVKGSWGLMALWVAVLAGMALLVGYLIKWEPMISGSGIPQVEGEIAGHLDQNWIKVIVGKLAGGALCIFGGLSLGREGPSIQLGAMAGKGFSRLLKRDKTEEKFLLTCGASAGLAAAFNAPLAGVLFALEEIHKNFSVTVLISVTTASIAADFVSKYVFGLEPVFRFSVGQMLPLREYGWVLLLGIILGVLGAVYNTVTLKSQSLYQKQKWLKPELRPLIPFLAAGLLGFTLPQTLGGGHTMIELLTDGRLLLQGVLLLLAVKFIFSAVSFGSGAPGGIFFPLLVLGSYIGGAYGMVLVQWAGLDPTLVNNFVILGMAGYFAAIVRAPITGIVLITEMNGSFTHLLALSMVSITAYIVANLLKSAPIYESLLERILSRQGIQRPEETGEKILSEFIIQHGSPIEGLTVGEVDWPKCLLIVIRRGNNEIIPKGDTVVLAGNILVALAEETEIPDVHQKIRSQCEG